MLVQQYSKAWSKKENADLTEKKGFASLLSPSCIPHKLRYITSVSTLFLEQLPHLFPYLSASLFNRTSFLDIKCSFLWQQIINFSPLLWFFFFEWLKKTLLEMGPFFKEGLKVYIKKKEEKNWRENCLFAVIKFIFFLCDFSLSSGVKWNEGRLTNLFPQRETGKAAAPEGQLEAISDNKGFVLLHR